MATCCSSKIGSFYPQSLWHNTHFKPCLGIKCSFLRDQWLPLCLNSFRWAGSLKRGGLRGPRLGPALVFGHQSERHSICPLLNPRLISWRNNAGLGGPSLDAEYDPDRFVLLDGELHGSMGSHALSAKSVFHYVCLVPPTFLSLNLPSLSTPFPGFPLPHWTVSFLQGNYRAAVETHHCCWAPWEVHPDFFFDFYKALSRIRHYSLISTRSRLLCVCELTDLPAAMAQQSAELSHC